MGPVETNKQALKEVDIPLTVDHDSFRDDLLYFDSKFPLEQMIVFQACYHDVQEKEGRGSPKCIGIDFGTNNDERKVSHISLFVLDQQ